MYTRLVKDFQLADFVDQFNKQNTDMRIKGKLYTVRVVEVVEENLLKLKFPNPKADLMDLLMEDQIFVLIFRVERGVYHLPLKITNKVETKHGINSLGELQGDVLHIERRRFERIEINKETSYFVDSTEYEGIIKNLSAIGALLISYNKIRTSKIVLDFSFASLTWTQLTAKVTWSQGNKYGLDFDFDSIEQHKELKDWLYS
ncbi:PilZ domain-containing protein [Fuchsiella alkaliacetigena]|uniref:PilZ domain-containing protein n=1 Tax=Fuchsiella alkaliacetigena TaxID=957042 RepID=UPI00200A3C94|nr:PilZ domain-containing protein [Fuchsiella alkaliacetigena]MCK8823655.1 PilZ domain-containing protein [Fuchsiella alkaliacetigena]